MPMRVKTPWIDALTQDREAQKADPQRSQPNVKPDLTPKKMSDSYYSAVWTSIAIFPLKDMCSVPVLTISRFSL
jgi:hypothetical protein